MALCGEKPTVSLQTRLAFTYLPIRNIEGHALVCIYENFHPHAVNTRLRACAARVIAVGLSVCVRVSVRPSVHRFSRTAATLSMKRGHIIK